MKTTLCLIAAGVLALSPPLFAADKQFHATVTGSMTYEEELGAGVTRITVKPLNNARVLNEFVPIITPKDYIVVVEGNLLRIVPKALNSPLPSWDVLEFKPATFSVHKTVPNIIQGFGQVAGATLWDNSFNKQLSGSYVFTLNLPANPNGIAHAINRGMAAGPTNFGPQANHTIIMQIKVTTGREFKPK